MRRAEIEFQAFDENCDLRIYYHGLLPHWRQKGCTYFVTFRLADSIPEAVLREIEYEESKWLEAHGIDRQLAIWKQRLVTLPRTIRRQFEQLVGKLVNCALDECHGSCILRNAEVAKQVESSLLHFDGKRIRTGDYVIMPNHVHVLITPLDDHDLEQVLRSVKSFTARSINTMLGSHGRIWQRESYDHIVRDREQLAAFQAYIAANPEKARLKLGSYLHRGAAYRFLE